MKEVNIAFQRAHTLKDLNPFDKIVINNGLSLKSDLAIKEAISLTTATVLEIKNADIPYAEVQLNTQIELDKKKVICITNDFLKNADVYIVYDFNAADLEAMTSGLKDLDTTQKELIKVKREKRKLEKALIKERAYCLKTKVVPGRTQESRKVKPKRILLNEQPFTTIKFNERYTISCYQQDMLTIAEIRKAGKKEIVSKGYAKCHKCDTFDALVGIELATAKAIMNFYKKLY